MGISSIVLWLVLLGLVIYIVSIYNTLVTLKNRYLKLNQIFLTQAGAVIALSMVLAFAYVEFADNLTDPNVRTLAYLCAGLASFGAISWLVLGPSFYIQCLHVLRQEQRE